MRLGYEYGFAVGQDADKSKKSNVDFTCSSVRSKGFPMTMFRGQAHLLFVGRILRQLRAYKEAGCLEQNVYLWPDSG